MRTLDIDREIADQQIPQSWHAAYRKALAGNRPAAVKVMCGQCQGWEDGARQAIRDCPSVGCPLHAVRPFQKKAGSGAVEIDTDADDTSEGDAAIDPGVFDLKEAILESMKVAARTPKQIAITNADLDAAKAKIIDHLYRHGQSARSYIIFSTGIDESLWTESIRELLAEGEIEREGEKRSTRYRLKEKP